jgi:hypothetical protein
MKARRVTAALWVSAVVYLLLAALLLGGLWQARDDTIRRLDSQAARAAWLDWQSDARRQNEQSGAPVQRRIARTDEPPLLVLLRDHFPAVAAVSLIVFTALYAFAALIVRGMLQGRSRQRAEGRGQ